MKDILIATTNEGKFHEISSFCKDLPYNFLKLQDLGLENDVVEEPFLTTAENAIQKARFFAEKSSLPTIAEDTGFFVEYLNGEPGVHAKRYAPTEKERNENILNALRGVEKNKRNAYFENSTCFFDSITSSFSVFKGVAKGLISEKVNAESRAGMGYDSIFFYEALQKHFSELSIAEKNLVSHRGQAMNKLKLFLSHQFDFKQIVVPVAIIVRDRKMFLNQRRDHYTLFNNKWEFPGGGVNESEEPTECLIREIKEETGFNIEVQELIPKIYTSTNRDSESPYQVFLLIYICSILDGELKTNEEESASSGWFSLEEVEKMELLPLNIKCIQENKQLLKKFID